MQSSLQRVAFAYRLKAMFILHVCLQAMVAHAWRRRGIFAGAPGWFGESCVLRLMFWLKIGVFASASCQHRAIQLILAGIFVRYVGTGGFSAACSGPKGISAKKMRICGFPGPRPSSLLCAPQS